MKKKIGFLAVLIVLVIISISGCATTLPVADYISGSAPVKISPAPSTPRVEAKIETKADWLETEISKKVRLPRNIEIIPPSVDTPPQIAAWSGRWEGIWSFGLNHVLVIEEVGPKKMKSIYAWGGIEGRYGYERTKAKVLDSGKKIEIYFPSQNPLTVVYEMGDDGIVHGKARQGNKNPNIVMKKVK